MIESPIMTPRQLAVPRAGALWRGLRANPLLMAGGAVVLLIVLVAIFAPLLAPHPGDAGTATHAFDVLKPPSAAHLFGTDWVGRDIFSRVLFGARVSPVIAVVVIAIACAVGVPLGVAAGQPDQRDDRDRRRVVAVVHQAHQGAGRLRRRAAVRRGVPCARGLPAAHHRQAHPAELRHAVARPGLPRRWGRDTDRVGPVVPRARRAGSGARL